MTKGVTNIARKKTARNSWSRMITELEVFGKKNGHCRVPANYAKNPALGRWVAAQRYKRKIGDLSDDEVKELDRLDFMWVPSDAAWRDMCSALLAFKEQHNHCNVPEHWADNQRLANWVQGQRYRRKKNKLSPDRIADLDKIGFSWAIYKCGDEPGMKMVKKSATEKGPSIDLGERLYVVRPGVYVQYNGNPQLPKELVKYKAEHKGELPAYIPLPRSATVFSVGESASRERRLKWSGKGPIPAEVLEYVKSNGTLPRYR